MNATSASRAEARPDAGAAASRRIIDAPTRAFHWLMALSFIGAYITADGERWRLVHVTLGYTLIGLVVFRLVWGLLGPRRVRLSALTGKLRGMPRFIASLRTGRPSWQLGQNVLQALAIVSLLSLAVLATASGYMLYSEMTGEWMEEVHEALSNAMLIVVLAHLAVLLVGSVLGRKNQAMPMVTGRVPGRGPDVVARNRAPLAALLVVAAASFWVWQWQTAPSGGADNAMTGDGPPAAARSRHHHGDDD